MSVLGGGAQLIQQLPWLSYILSASRNEHILVSETQFKDHLYGRLMQCLEVRLTLHFDKLQQYLKNAHTPSPKLS